MAELAGVVVGERLQDFALAVHDERAVLDDRLIDRLAAQSSSWASESASMCTRSPAFSKTTKSSSAAFVPLIVRAPFITSSPALCRAGIANSAVPLGVQPDVENVDRRERLRGTGDALVLAGEDAHRARTVRLASPGPSDRRAMLW